MLNLGQVQGLWPGEHEFVGGDALERQAVAADRLDMLGPGVDQRDVEPVMREVSGGVAADCAGADDDDALVHSSCSLCNPVAGMISSIRAAARTKPFLINRRTAIT